MKRNFAGKLLVKPMQEPQKLLVPMSLMAFADKLQLRRLRGEVALLETSGIVEEKFYRSQVDPGLATSAVEHYLLHGAATGVDPNPWFKTAWYLRMNPDVASAGINPLVHFLLFGAKDNRNPHPLFNLSWYLHQNPDVAASGVNALQHYVRHGAAEGREQHQRLSPGLFK